MSMGNYKAARQEAAHNARTSEPIISVNVSFYRFAGGKFYSFGLLSEGINMLLSADYETVSGSIWRRFVLAFKNHYNVEPPSFNNFKIARDETKTRKPTLPFETLADIVDPNKGIKSGIKVQLALIALDDNEILLVS